MPESTSNNPSKFVVTGISVAAGLGLVGAMAATSPSDPGTAETVVMVPAPREIIVVVESPTGAVQSETVTVEIPTPPAAVDPVPVEPPPATRSQGS